MSPFDQRLRANLVHVDVEGGSGMIFATAVTKMLQPAAEIRLPGLYDLFRVPTGGSARMAITPPRCRQRSRRAAPSTAVDRSKPRRYGPRAMVAASRLLGRSQVVRQRILIPPFPGSSPGIPANPFGHQTRVVWPSHSRHGERPGCRRTDGSPWRMVSGVFAATPSSLSKLLNLPNPRRPNDDRRLRSRAVRGSAVCHRGSLRHRWPVQV